MRRDRQRLNDILEALDWIAKAIAGRVEADFLADETLCYAVAQKLTIIGEAVARLSPEITARHNSVPWPDIVGLNGFFRLTLMKSSKMLSKQEYIDSSEEVPVLNSLLLICGVTLIILE